MSKIRKPGHEAPARIYRLSIVPPLMLTFIGSPLLIILGMFFHRGLGQEETDTYLVSFFQSLFTFAPIGLLFFAWMRFDVWKALHKDKTYVWQGWATLVLSWLFAVGGLCWLIYITIFADYRAFDPNVSDELFIDKCSNTLPGRLSPYFTVNSVMWTIALAFGLFSTEAQSKPQESTAEKK